MSQLANTSIVDFRTGENLSDLDETQCFLGNYFVLQRTVNLKQLIPDYHCLKQNVITIFDEEQNRNETIRKLKQTFPTKTFTCLDITSLLSLFPELRKTDTTLHRGFPTYHWSQVLKNLFIGDSVFARDNDMIDKMNIKAIINLAPDCCSNKYEANSKFSYYTIYELDTEENTLRPYFHSTNRFIEKHILSEAVLVHCAAGVSRSSTIVIAYLMYKLGLEFEDAFRFLKNCHPQAYPNRQFYCDLINFQNEIMPKKY